MKKIPFQCNFPQNNSCEFLFGEHCLFQMVQLGKGSRGESAHIMAGTHEWDTRFYKQLFHNVQLALGHSETCLKFTLRGRAKCSLLLDSHQGTFEIQTWTVEPLSTWLKQGNTSQGVTGFVIKLLSYNIITAPSAKEKLCSVPAVMFNYFIWTVSDPHCLILNAKLV